VWFRRIVPRCHNAPAPVRPVSDHDENIVLLLCRTFQIVFTSLMLSTLFFRTTRHPTSIDEADYYAGRISSSI
jgi:hypothetical protein